MTEKFSKEAWKPGTLIYPLPAVLVSCGATPEEYNMLTIAWTGTVCTNPPMCYISVRKERHSYDIIRRTGEFAINLTTEEMSRATDWCGVRSGKDNNKWEATGLTPMENEYISAPIIAESPLSICCKVREVVELGTHDMFIADVVAVEADEGLFDSKGALHMEKADLCAYVHGAYFSLGKKIGNFGFSAVKKKKKGTKGNGKGKN